MRDHEPELALFCGNDPLMFYRRLCEMAPVLLEPGGFLAVEVHADYGRDVLDLFVDSGLEAVELHRDLAGRQRIVSGRSKAGEKTA